MAKRKRRFDESERAYKKREKTGAWLNLNGRTVTAQDVGWALLAFAITRQVWVVVGESLILVK